MGNVQMEASMIRYGSGTVKSALDNGGGGGGASTLAALTDTAIATPTDGQVLAYDSTAEKWENASPELSNLADTAITTPTDGQVLKYDNTAGKWVNGSGGSGGSGVVIAETETKIGTFAGADLFAIAVPITSIANAGTLDLTGIPSGATIHGTWGGIVEGGTFKALPFYTNVSTPGPIGFEISYATNKWIATWRCPSAHATVSGHLVVFYTKESENNR